MTVTLGGDSHNNFTVAMTSNTLFILSAWVVPLWVSGEETRLILKAKDMKVKVMGITFSGLTMRNDMVCRCVTGAPQITIPNSVCYPDDLHHEEVSALAYHAICDVYVPASGKPTTSKVEMAASIIA